MVDRVSTCCFTGHRSEKLPWGRDESDPGCVMLKEKIYDAAEAVYSSGIRHFICGMARGCDLYFAEAVIKLRAEYPNITLEAAVPHRGQASRWNPEDREKYEYLLDRCDTVTVLSDRYTPSCMERRNKYMVDCSAVVIAAYNGTTGGTLNTLRYAISRELEIVTLWF